MAPVRLISPTQLELIVEFAERNKHMSVRPTGYMAHKNVNQAWVELAKNLNAVEDGVKRTPEQWKRYWHLLKCRTKAKAADIRRKRAGAVDDGKQNKLFPLTDLEKRITWAIGMVGVHNVRALQAPSDEVKAADPRPIPEVKKVERPRYSSSESSAEVKAAAPRPRPIPKVKKVERPRYSSSDHDKQDLPKWLCDMEERRIASEERLTNAVISLSTTNESILQCLQEMSDTHAKLLGLLGRHLNSKLD